MEILFFIALWVGAIVFASVLGDKRGTTTISIMLAVFLGWLGVLASLLFDNRPVCRECGSRTNLHGRICSACGAPRRVRVVNRRAPPPRYDSQEWTEEKAENWVDGLR